MLTEKKVIKMYGNNKPWITSSLRKMITDKHSFSLKTHQTTR